MSPLIPDEQREFSPSIKLQGWRNDETRVFKFLDNGQDRTHSEYGLQFVYAVVWEGETYDLWVKPGSALAIGLTRILTKEEPYLSGRVVKILKKTGERQKDTRYIANFYVGDKSE